MPGAIASALSQVRRGVLASGGVLLLVASPCGCGSESAERSSSVPAPTSLAPVELPPRAEAVLVTVGHASTPRARPRREAAVSANASCEACHLEEARAWRASLHRRAANDPAYRRALAIEPSPFCRGCHAPEGDPARDASPAVRDLGVACVTCHVTDDGSVLAAHEPAEAALAAHPIRRSEDLARTGACGGCHELRFPTPRRDDDDGSFMQTTAREHARSPAADQSCATCHMPPGVDGRRSHAFAETRDPAWLAASLDVRAARSGDHGVSLTLAQNAPGHAFPTGDLFRRLEVGAELRAPDGTLVRRETRALARHFELVPGRAGRTLTLDDRVFFEPLTVDLALDEGAPLRAAGSISWWVTLQRVATVGEGTDPRDAQIESEVRLRSGVLSWSPRKE